MERGPAFVLVRPARAANVAAACRALKNMGFDDLRLVEPPAGLREPAARALAYGAWDVLEGAAVCADLAAAVADAEWVVGTSGRQAAGALAPRAFARESGSRAGRVALVFGPERHGLTTRELDLCHARVYIPTAPRQSSLNLAQAVLLLAYVLAEVGVAAAAPLAAAAAAPAGELEAALLHWRAALLEIGFLDPQNPDARLAELRRLLARARPSARELRLLRGVARQVSWAGRVARERRPAR